MSVDGGDAGTTVTTPEDDADETIPWADFLATLSPAEQKALSRSSASGDAELLPPEQATTVSRSMMIKKGKSKGKLINARMLQAIQNRPEASGWSLRQWATHLDCAPSTVAATKTWTEILLAGRAVRLAKEATKRERSGSGKKSRS